MERTGRERMHPDVNSAPGWYALGAAALAKGELESAEAAFRRAVEMDPEHANALYRLGEFVQRTGRGQEAAELYRRALGANPGHVSARRRLDDLEAARRTDTPAQPLAREPSADALAGVVSALQQRFEQDRSRLSVLVVSFRVERRGADGTSYPPVPVELRGQSLRGAVANGDWVELPGGWRPGSRLRTFVNLTTGAEVGMDDRGSLGRGARLVVTALVSVWIVVLFSVVLAVLGTAFLERFQ
jgi:hypothetical protein